MVPVQWRIIRARYSCRSCEKIVQAPAPVKAIARGKATFSMLAHVITAKFDHHLPVYRQAEMMADRVSTSTARHWRAGPDKPPPCSTRSSRAPARKG